MIKFCPRCYSNLEKVICHCFDVIDRKKRVDAYSTKRGDKKE